MNDTVYALAVSRGDVYAGGDFTTSCCGIPMNYIAKRRGGSWYALGSGMNASVYALAVSGRDLYVGGDFETAGNKVSPSFAKARIPEERRGQITSQ